MTVLGDVTTYLAGAGLGLTVATNLFYGQMPDTPDDCVVVYERPGTRPDFTLGATEGQPHLPNFENVRLQVVVRRDGETAYAEGSALITSIWRALSLGGGITLSGTRYLSIEPMDSPAPMDEDKQGRLLFVANFWAQPEVS